MNVPEGRKQSVEDIGSVDADLSQTQTKLLDYFASLDNFVAFWALRYILARSEEGNVDGVTHESASHVFSLTQGGSGWEAELESRVTGIIPKAIDAVEALLTSLTFLGEEDGMEVLATQLEAKLEAQYADIIAAHKSDDEGLVPGKATYDAADVPAFKAAYDQRAKKAMKKLLRVLKTAVSKMKGSEGLIKLNECIKELKVSELYMMTKRPVELPSDVAGMYDKLNVPVSLRNFVNGGVLKAAWNAHRDEWTEEKHGKMSAAETFVYWTEAAKTSKTKTLAQLALRHLLRPISAASCERVFSYLTLMDVSNRRNMGRPLLMSLLKLRGNAETVLELAAETADAMRTAKEQTSTSHKRKLEADRQTAAAAVFSAAAASATAPRPAKAARLSCFSDDSD
jgi:predicted ArsR family transcriptional regulator